MPYKSLPWTKYYKITLSCHAEAADNAYADHLNRGINRRAGTRPAPTVPAG